MPEIISTRFDDALKHMNHYEPSVLTAPAATTVPELCRILVPFAHYLRRAMVAASGITLGDATVASLTVKLMAAAPGGAKAGVQVGATVSSQTHFTANAALTAVNLFALSTADQSALRAAGTIYKVQLQGLQAGDVWKTPMLTIGVEPVNRTEF